jgi:hypothetical protein
MWLYRTSTHAKQPAVAYQYQQSRSHEHPKAFLKGFSGWCHADGYSGYHRLADNIRIVGCWAHARRKFDETLKALAEDGRAGFAAATGLGYINRLFKLEKAFALLGPDERHKARLAESLPVAEDLYLWATGVGALPKSLLGKAVCYLTEQREYLMRVFEDGRLELSNTPKGAEASAGIFSIIETAKANRLFLMSTLNIYSSGCQSSPRRASRTCCHGATSCQIMSRCRLQRSDRDQCSRLQ